MHMHPSFANERHESFASKQKGRRSADRRNQPLSAPHIQALPPERAAGAEATPAGGRSPLGAPPRLLSSDRMLGLSPGRASRERAGTGVTRAVNRA